jgi:hypothetical protein
MLVLSESHYDQQVSVEDTLSVMRYASETRISLKWSGWRDLNARLLRPERKKTQKTKANDFNLLLISLAFLLLQVVGKC